MGFFSKLKNKAQEAVQNTAQSAAPAAPAAPDVDMDDDDDDDDDDDGDGYSVVNSDWCDRNLAAGNVNYFGNFNPDDLNRFWYVYFELEEAEQNGRLDEKFAEFGFRGGKEEWGALWASFYYRHFYGLGEEAAQQKFLQSMMDARNIQAVERMNNAQAANPQLTAPVEGVTVEMWAQAAAMMAQTQDMAAQEQQLAAMGMDRARYERANAEFQARMQGDTSFVIANIYGQAFSGALGVQGGYGRGNADGSAQQLGEEPCTFEQYAEITAAQSAWAQQGHDVNAMLQQSFGIDAIGFSKYGAYWSTRFSADPNLAMQFGDLLQKYEAKYGGGSAGGMDDDLSF